MLKINKELSQKIIKLEELKSYISIVVDYEKEEEYSNEHNRIMNEIQQIDENFTLKDIESIINIIDEPIDYYLYSTDDIIETLFPDYIKRNKYIISAYYWIEEENRISWIINNVLEVASSKVYYDVVNNVNDNYIISTQKLSSISIL